MNACLHRSQETQDATNTQHKCNCVANCVGGTTKTTHTHTHPSTPLSLIYTIEIASYTVLLILQ